ncbi:MAG: hypothetical protein M3P50_13870 [Actinomycetota bacterium]|nr:hypothetical protein [Actinomycetota bacterium]
MDPRGAAWRPALFPASSSGAGSPGAAVVSVSIRSVRLAASGDADRGLVVRVFWWLRGVSARAAQPGGTVPDETSAGERPLYKDPDPEGMAGGRTTSEPPKR